MINNCQCAALCFLFLVYRSSFLFGGRLSQPPQVLKPRIIRMAKKLIKGNDAIAMAAIEAGCRYYYGYPITPQNDIPEYLAREFPKVGGTFLQAESEVAAINMVLGSAASGKRAMISSSGPGISLMQEGLSYMSGSEVPCVVVNIQRSGPGLGGISPSQGDYFQATRGGGHGDYRTPVLAPCVRAGNV